MDKQQAVKRIEIFAPKGTEVRIVITHVSRSGMERRMRAFVANKAEVVDLTAAFAIVYGASMDWRGVKVRGCGMDMAFHLVYSVASEVYADGYALTSRV